MYMIILASKVIGKPVLTIRAGRAAATVTGVLIDPFKLQVAGFWVQKGAKAKGSHLLLSQDIREFTMRGVIIDDTASIVETDDLPRFKEIFEIDYQIPGKKVISGRRKHGKATDFGINTATLHIASITGKPSLTRMLGSTSFSFARKQIKSINDSTIEVNDSPLGISLKDSLPKSKTRTKSVYQASSEL